MRGVILYLCLILLGLPFTLVGIAAGNVAEKGLGSARGRVDIGLEGGGVLVRHIVGVEEFCLKSEFDFLEFVD
jgi:hypothetical protein